MQEVEAKGLNPFPESSGAKAVTLPPRPALLMALQRETAKPSPHLQKIAELVSRDAAIAGALLQVANSPFFHTRSRIRTVAEAVALLGLDQCTAVMTGIITRRILSMGQMMMARFWDVSEKRARGLSFMAKEMRAVSPDLAYSFGLFCDIGIPLMRGQFSSYKETLMIANQKAAGEFIQVENDRHGVNHTDVGAALADKWGISVHVTRAIRTHHIPEVLYEDMAPAPVRALTACIFLVEKAIQEYRGEAESLEWREGGGMASEALSLSEKDVQALTERLTLLFATKG